jgi:predicted Ser/Thr protein kinase
MTFSVADTPYAPARARCGACIHPARSVAQADLYELDWEGQPALLKDFSARPLWVRRVWARPVLARELRVLRALEGLEGTPALWATAGPDAYIMQRLAAGRLPNKKHRTVPPEYWPRLRALIEALHARGIAHGDLRRKNILIDAQAQPYLIDFATAVRRKPGSRLSAFLFERCRRIDLITYARLKMFYSEGMIDGEERAWLARTPWYLRAGRGFKRYIFCWRKPRAWRKLFGRKGKP